MTRFLAYWLTTAIALGAAAWILPGVSITSAPALAVSALVLGMVNAVVRPILVVLTLPLTFLTLGVFYLVVNGVAFSLAAWLVDRIRGPLLRLGGAGRDPRRLRLAVHRRVGPATDAAAARRSAERERRA